MPSERLIAPHGLLLGVRRYLIVRDIAKKGGRLQHYRVEEIYSAQVLEESLELDPGFNIRSHAEKGFGSYESAAEHGEVVWRFSPDAAPHARRFVFHPAQIVEEEAIGSLLVRFRASGHLEMCWHLTRGAGPSRCCSRRGCRRWYMAISGNSMRYPNHILLPFVAIPVPKGLTSTYQSPPIFSLSGHYTQFWLITRSIVRIPSRRSMLTTAI